MRYILTEEIIGKFPSVCIGIIPARNIGNSGNNREILALLRQAESSIKGKFAGIMTSEHPRIKCWREAYSSFGSKPKKYMCSIEAMSKRILEGGSIPDINDIVNLYNCISLKYLISLGGDDADKIVGDVKLMLAKGNEEFAEIGQQEVRNPDVGEAIFADDKGVLGRRWNWRQGDRTKITKNSRNVNLQIEGISPVARNDIEQAANEIIGLLKNFFKVEQQFYILDKENPILQI